eukprot:TRINITY_DN483_c0_g1_i2.p1 TRINITY_DN483_c0_g1~~TRINITY_DN483_c0_g1_i2.p1  ORF type:complete len:207 (-),score=32.68 TRINITY_DN483_c0_g1_i2:25-645(-)
MCMGTSLDCANVLSRQEEAKRGNLWEFHEMKGSNGKLFPGGATNGDKQFPALEGKDVTGRTKTIKNSDFLKHPLNIVFVSQKRLLTHYNILSWKRPMFKLFPMIPQYEVIIPTNIGYYLFDPLMWYRIKKDYNSEDLQKIIQMKIFTSVLEKDIKLECENSYTNYVYVVNKFGKIVWKACGSAESPELIGLKEFIDQYCKEYNYKL